MNATEQPNKQVKLTRQQKMLIEKLTQGFRVYTTGYGKISIYGANGSVQYLGRVALKNMWTLERHGIVRSEFLVSVQQSQFFLVQK